MTVIGFDADGSPENAGSGFVVSEGLVATNYHVLEGCTSARLSFAGGMHHPVVGVVASNADLDLVILRIDRIVRSALPLAERDAARGDRIFVIGSPLGLEGTMTDGLVSGIREVDGRDLLQISAPISSGSSGGPVLSEGGEVVGVTVSSLEGGQNLNFAIPARYLRTMLAETTEPQPLTESVPRRHVSENLKSLADAKSDYEADLRQIWDSAAAERQAILDDTTKEVREFRARSQQAGDLDDVMAAESLLAQLETGNFALRMEINLPRPLESIVSRFQNATERAELETQNAALSRLSDYISALETLERDLTRDGKIHEALRVRVEFDQASQQQLSRSLRHGLVLYYTFDHEGAFVRDQGQYQHDGLHGRRSEGEYSASVLGGLALHCGVSGDYIEVPGLPTVGQGLSVSVWVRPKSLSDRAFERPVVSCNQIRSNELRGWAVRIANSIVEFQFKSDGPSSNAIGRIQVAEDAWHHIVGVFNGTTVSVWFDGRRLASVPLQNRHIQSDGVLNIGRDPAYPERQFRGLIDELRMYERALSASEIARLYHIGASRLP